MRRLGWVIGLLAFVLCLALGPGRALAQKKHPERVLLDGVAAVVDGQPMIISEVQMQGRLLLLEQVGPGATRQPLDEAFLKKVLDFMVLQALLAREGRAARSEGALAARTQERVDQYRGRFPSDEAYLRFLSENNISERAVKAFSRRDALADAAIAALLPAPPPPALAEVDAELKARPQRYVAFADLERKRRLARAALQRERQKKAVATLSAKLKARHEIRRVASPKDLAAGEPPPLPPDLPERGDPEGVDGEDE
jgi:hypothetical protein